jgi:uncharacterized membrane protein YkvA (DUF1232 family)
LQSLAPVAAAIMPRCAGAISTRQDAGVWSDWWTIALGAVAGLLLPWLALVAASWLTKPDEAGIRETMRLLPDLLRLFKRLAADPTMSKAVRIWLVLLFGYLALPIDLIPDFIPVLGYADDAVIVALVLRYITRKAGPDAIAKHWPGTPDGLAAVRKLCRLPITP